MELGDGSRTEQASVGPKGGRNDCDRICRNKAGARERLGLGFGEKEILTRHQAAAKGNSIWRVERCEVGEAYAEVVGETIQGLECHRVASAGQCEDLVGAELVASLCLLVVPFGKSRAAGECFPTALRTAVAIGTGRVNRHVAWLRVGAVCPAINFPVEYKACADAGTEGNEEEAAKIIAATPRSLGQRCGVAIVFQGYRKIKGFLKSARQGEALPAGEEGDVADSARERVHWACATDADGSYFCARRLENGCDPVDCVEGTSLRVGGKFFAF